MLCSLSDDRDIEMFPLRTSIADRDIEMFPLRTSIADRDIEMFYSLSDCEGIFDIHLSTFVSRHLSSVGPRRNKDPLERQQIYRYLHSCQEVASKNCCCSLVSLD